FASLTMFAFGVIGLRRHWAFDRHPAPSIQHPASSIQHPTSNIKKISFTLNFFVSTANFDIILKVKRNTLIHPALKKILLKCDLPQVKNC
ncbi:MAG: hypothetical protein KDE62_06365, partial [Calditrichaeota bacterium]|nr:hypothetical protein [Calditrichota bacterium]